LLFCLCVMQYAVVIVLIILLEVAAAILAGVFHSKVMNECMVKLVVMAAHCYYY